MLCEAFYCPLHLLEVGLRNAIDGAFRAKHGAEWLTGPRALRMLDWEIATRDQARETVGKNGHAVTHGRLVAEVPFAFWTGLLSSEYEHAWHGCIRLAFPGLPSARRKRSVPHERLHILRTFRNKVFHHQRIAHLPVADRHAEIREVLGWINPELLALLDVSDSFPQVHRRGRSAANRLVARLSNPQELIEVSAGG